MQHKGRKLTITPTQAASPSTHLTFHNTYLRPLGPTLHTLGWGLVGLAQSLGEKHYDFSAEKVEKLRTWPRWGVFLSFFFLRMADPITVEKQKIEAKDLLEE